MKELNIKKQKNTIIQQLECVLSGKGNDFIALTKTFIEHTKSDFIDHFLMLEWRNIEKSDDHVVNNIARQLQIILINTSKFDYTVQLRRPGIMNASDIKWMGISQVVSVKGRGSIKIKILEVPGTVNINNFQPGISLSILKEVELKNGDSYSCQGTHQILDIVEVTDTVIIESLSVKEEKTNLFWTFNHNLKSYMSESSNLLISRLTTMLNVASQMKINLPHTLYETIFEVGDPNLKLSTLQIMLLQDNFEAFDYLQKAIDSADEILSEGAQEVLNRLTYSN